MMRLERMLTSPSFPCFIFGYFLSVGWWKGQLNGIIGKFPANRCVPHVDYPDDTDNNNNSSSPLPTLNNANPTPKEGDSSTTINTTSAGNPPTDNSSTNNSSKKIKVQVLYSFEKKKPSQLSMRKGEVITVITQHSSGWWIGKLNDRVGKFPSNYTTVVADEKDGNNENEIEEDDEDSDDDEEGEN